MDFVFRIVYTCVKINDDLLLFRTSAPEARLVSAASKSIINCKQHYTNKALTKPDKRIRHVRCPSRWANQVGREGIEIDMPAENGAATRSAFLALSSAVLGYARPADSALQLLATHQNVLICVRLYTIMRSQKTPETDS